MAQGSGFVADPQLVKGSGSGTKEWREDFVLTANDSQTPLFQVQRSSGAVMFANMTTTQKNALTVPAGSVVYDTTLGKLSMYNGTSWQAVTSA